MTEPRDLAEAAERSQPRFRGEKEQFAGYGVMGLPLSSGHILGLRRFPASSVGPGYTSVWHRTPDRRWTFYTDVEPLQSCNRFFGSEVERVETTEIDIAWNGPRSFSVRAPGRAVEWDVELTSTLVTQVMNGIGRLLPDALWRSPLVLEAMAVMASALLGAGPLRLRGKVPNGQEFIANPRLMWTIPSSRVVIGGDNLGRPVRMKEEVRLQDFRIPQRGIFIFGRALFEPFDITRHLAAATRSAG